MSSFEQVQQGEGEQEAGFLRHGDLNAFHQSLLHHLHIAVVLLQQEGFQGIGGLQRDPCEDEGLWIIGCGCGYGIQDRQDILLRGDRICREARIHQVDRSRQQTITNSLQVGNKRFIRTTTTDRSKRRKGILIQKKGSTGKGKTTCLRGRDGRQE